MEGRCYTNLLFTNFTIQEMSSTSTRFHTVFFYPCLSKPKEISKTRFWNTQISGELSNFLKIWLWNCVLALPSTEQEYCKVLLYKEFEYYEQRYPQGPRVRSMYVSQPGKIISESGFKKCASVWNNRRDN